MDNLPQEFQTRLSQLFPGEHLSLTPLSGGDINQTFQLNTERGSYCLKYNNNCPADFFHAEAHGLKTLSELSPIRTPEVFTADKSMLLMEYINAGSRSKYFWSELGESLAQQHKKTSPTFGLERHNYCGLTPQMNSPCENGYEFFAENRLEYQTKLAFDAGCLSRPLKNRIAKLSEALDRHIPLQPASLLHGDLWSGNIHCDEDGKPMLIDPACYFGWREADIAMTMLFGGFNPVFYEAYQSFYPMDDNWRERVPLYNLYHLLNHLNLFGESYLYQIEQVVKRFT